MLDSVDNETLPFGGPVERLTRPWRSTLAGELDAIPGLAPDERALVLAAGSDALVQSLHAKLSRVFLIELHARRLAAGAAGDGEIWADYLEEATREGYLTSIAGRYPVLPRRVERVARASVAAVAGFAARLAADRPAFDEALRGPLKAVVFGRGDTHRGGLTVSRVDVGAGTIMYKPRNSAIDVALAALIRDVYERFPGVPAPAERIRVPRVLLRDGYGWADYVEPRYCADERELGVFYRNIGHWLAILRLCGGTDMHAENMIAAGPVPVVVDAETLFDAPAEFPASGQGDAVDVATAAIRRTVLRTGLLPVRGTGYALGGVDISGIGALPGQQPRIPAPVIADAGTGSARLQVDLVDVPAAGNHPSPKPVLHAYWDRVLEGFQEMTAHLHRLDTGPAGDVHHLLRHFDGVEARRLLRPTQAYVDIGRMLWHPASLHDEAAALERGRDILLRNAKVLYGAPQDRPTIDAEIADLLAGDVPLFSFTVDDAAIAASVADWRGADLPFEESIIQDALVGAYLNERTLPSRRQYPAHEPHCRNRERRRRALAARLVRQLCDGGVRGADGTVTWVSPVFTPAGWSIRVLPADLYTGQGGVVLTLAEYLAEVRAGRADEVAGVQECFDGALRVLMSVEELTETPSAGAFSGAASQVWTWLALHRVLGWDWLPDRAAERAGQFSDGRMIAEDREVDLLNGVAGAGVPLLDLAETGRPEWLPVAAAVGNRLVELAVHEDYGARWPTRLNPEGIGGFAHGATGVGWTLMRLALSDAGTAAERAAWRALAERAFAYQEWLYRPEEGNWFDARIGSEEDFFTSWCHGSAGIGLAMLDLHSRTGEARWLEMAVRAARASAAEGFGWSHTLCHGDMGLWEMLDAIRSADPSWDGPDRDEIDGELLTGLEQRGPVGGLAREAFSPSLMSGLAGVVHGLLRMHPEQRMPSPLLLD
ncbi:type 2 lanthipeptide synthetase LanM family protein [Amycolatopsis sp. NPDC049252]|uniref:type 2 lanthipeptide synthetase LanM family protein n=1 Tax=Amycolatopsis sp. NPDC049252 TaxID=3363933 RepID=UPI0037141299